jgi:ornithine carbamoyltransferase
MSWKGNSVAMIFEKYSTRTRVSSEAGVAMLGGHPIFLSKNDIQLGKNETFKDTAKVLSRFNSTIMARVMAHSSVAELAKEAEVPVINALCDMYHPLQVIYVMETSS